MEGEQHETVFVGPMGLTAVALLWLAEIVLVLFVDLMWMACCSAVAGYGGMAPFVDLWRWMAAALLWLVADQWRLTARQTVIFPSVFIVEVGRWS